jgi:hypothetical protein
MLPTVFSEYLSPHNAVRCCTTYELDEYSFYLATLFVGKISRRRISSKNYINVVSINLFPATDMVMLFTVCFLDNLPYSLRYVEDLYSMSRRSVDDLIKICRESASACSNHVLGLSYDLFHI